MPAKSGKEYIERINKLNGNVWLEGKKITGKLTDHKAFSGVIHSQSQLFDLQLKDSMLDIMTYKSPTTGERVGLSFLEPRSKEDLKRRRVMIQEWAKLSGGMLGRSPDYMNTVIMAISTASDILKKQDPIFSQNLDKYYEYVRENDLTLTHTFINPQVNRSEVHFENGTEIIAAQPIKRTKDGLIIKGARLLATQGGITDEILVLPTGASSYNHDLAYGFAIPTDTKGLKFICRESYRYNESSFNHPLGSRFEENDAIVVFDNVLVPWDRVFFHQNSELAEQIYSESSFFPLTTHQVLCRRIVKTEFILGIAQLLVDSIKIGGFQHVQEKISEIITGLETLKALVIASEMNATVNQWGTMIPDENCMKAATSLYPKLYPRYMEILQLLGASGLVSTPTDADYSTEIKDDLFTYLRAETLESRERVALFRLAWDLCMSAFGTRQTLYERFFFGDPVRLNCGLYQSYDKSSYTNYVSDFLNINSQ